MGSTVARSGSSKSTFSSQCTKLFDVDKLMPPKVKERNEAMILTYPAGRAFDGLHGARS